MAGGEDPKLRGEQIGERASNRVHREVLVAIPPQNQGRNEAGLQVSENASSVARIEIPRRPDQSAAAFRALVRREDLTHSFSQATCEHRRETPCLCYLPGLDAGRRLHRPLPSIDPVHQHEGADPVGRAHEHELRGGRAHIVGHHRGPLDVQPVHQLEHPAAWFTMPTPTLGAALTRRTRLDLERERDVPLEPAAGRPATTAGASQESRAEANTGSPAPSSSKPTRASPSATSGHA